ncbi:MAG TPA: response regulator [Bryobacteraceae bacterium]|nr:response regulator [Bryobacteraceae bacterium]
MRANAMAHILLIEDNPADVLMIREAIRANGVPADTVVVSDGEQAVSLLNSGFTPDLVILDLNIPRCSGVEVLERWNIGPKPPIIVFSNSASACVSDNETKLGVREKIGKPSDVLEFMNVISSTLWRWLT